MTDTQPSDFFDYAGAIEDLYERFERARQWIGDNLNSPALYEVYKHSLELTFAMMAFREVVEPEAL